MDEDVSSLTLERDFLLRLLGLAQHDEPKMLLEEALQIVLQLSAARHGYIELASPKGKAGVNRFAATTERADAKLVRSALSSTIIATALADGRTVHTRAAFEDPRFAEAPSVRANQIEAVVCVPINAKPNDGVIYLQGSPDGKPFSPRVVQLCELFARHLAVIAPTLVRRALQAAEDPTARWRDKLVGAEALVGSSEGLAAALKTAASAAPLDIGVLISGPSGSGKTELAKVIARNGARAKGPFIPLNCANLQAALTESELFGAMSGAHSTATQRVYGKVESAHKGTLFLDEVSELALPIQAKLLQFLQDGTFFPLGSAKPLTADVRVIAASNASLVSKIRQGLFREDLYYRLCVVEIVMPTLEERRLDIALLAEQFLREAISRHGLPQQRISPRGLRALELAEWPGNVRQLKNAVEAAAVRALGDEVASIEPEHLFPGTRQPDLDLTYHAVMRRYQREIIEEALQRHGWNVPEAAAALGLGRSSLYQLIKGLGIERTAEPVRVSQASRMVGPNRAG